MRATEGKFWMFETVRRLPPGVLRFLFRVNDVMRKATRAKTGFRIAGEVNDVPICWNTSEPAVTRRGQGLVEFALILPVFLLLILGIVEFGRLMITYSSISTASRDAARYAVSVGYSPSGVPHYQDCLGIRAAAQNVTLFADATIVISYDTDGPGAAAPVEYCQVGKTVDPIDVSLGTQLRVTITDIYDPLLPLIELPVIPLTSETARTVLRDVYVK